jgi:beta-glucosidase
VRDVGARSPAPNRELRGFERIHLKAGETRRVAFLLVPSRDLARYDEGTRAMAVAPGPFEVEVGASSADLRLRAQARVE